MKSILIALICLTFTACTTVRPDAAIFESVEQAIQTAESVGGDEFAPVEMRFAREKLASAKKGMEKEKYVVAVYLVEEAEINAELAIEKSRTAKSRRRVNELRKSNEELEARMYATFGDEFK
ncbi:MAG: DUF4398 domain-containing protein [Xanthomonadales bacterium]|nr:DUF4398 domain-containing protein [Xanthomonadales bacterium]